MMIRACVIGLIFLLTACAIPLVDRERPDAQVTSFKVLPSDGVAPRFEIGLHVVNPTWLPLELKELTYHVEVEGHMILSGATNDLPGIEAYGEEDLRLVVSMDISNGLRLLTDLLARLRDTVTYSLNAKLDVGVLRPSIRINNTGEISLASPSRQ